MATEGCWHCQLFRTDIYECIYVYRPVVASFGIERHAGRVFSTTIPSNSVDVVAGNGRINKLVAIVADMKRVGFKINRSETKVFVGTAAVSGRCINQTGKSQSLSQGLARNEPRIFMREDEHNRICPQASTQHSKEASE